MESTWRFYILAVNIASFYCIVANQPAGYSGCFLDKHGDSMVNPVVLFVDQSNTTGEYCKRMVRTKFKRYAGTKLWRCFGGDDYNKKRSSTECNRKCPGNSDEICGDIHLIVIYDTWMCITSPCENGATCNDINADTFTCNCTEGWTGHLCNETVSTTLVYSKNLSSSFDATWLSDTSESTITKTTQSGRNQQLIYIFVLVGIVVVVVAVLIPVLIIKRKRNAVSKNGGEVNRTVQVHGLSVQTTTAESYATKEGSIHYIDPPDDQDGGYEMPESNYEHLNSAVVIGDTYSQLEMVTSTDVIAAKEESVYQNTFTNTVPTNFQDECGEFAVDERSYEHFNSAMVQDFTYSRLGSKEAMNT